MHNFDVIVVGGGAAGFFAAINIAEQRPEYKVAILERGKEGLQKVKISGGGRCNVTHAEFVPNDLVENYPRGKKELLGPFHQFMTGDTIEWFESRGVPLKIESDGRMFPESNTSQTIIDCFLSEAKKHNVNVLYNHALKKINHSSNLWELETSQGLLVTKNVVMATGSNPKMWHMLEHLGHTIDAPVPSLFTFDVKDKRISNIPGVVSPHVEISVLDTDLVSEGPLLITHVGFSAPAVLKLSAFGALELAERNYNFKIQINFIRRDFYDCVEQLKDFKQTQSKKTVYNTHAFDLPKRLWQQLVLASNIGLETRWADCRNIELDALAAQLTQAVFQVTAKSTFKDEFVTAGGINLKEVNFKTFESKVCPNLFFAGEILNIDAITGGFNFQNAWTSGYLVARTLSGI